MPLGPSFLQKLFHQQVGNKKYSARLAYFHRISNRTITHYSHSNTYHWFKPLKKLTTNNKPSRIWASFEPHKRTSPLVIFPFLYVRFLWGSTQSKPESTCPQLLHWSKAQKQRKRKDGVQTRKETSKSDSQGFHFMNHPWTLWLGEKVYFKYNIEAYS